MMDKMKVHEEYFLKLEKQQQLGLGLYTTPEMMSNFARQKFMLVISIEVPECIEGLKLILAQNLQLIQNFLHKTQNKFPSSLREIIQYEEGMELYEIIFQWCYYWNMKEEWIIENALIAIRSWLNDIELFNHVYWYNNPENTNFALDRACKLLGSMERELDFPKSIGNYCPFLHKNRAEYNKMLADYMYKVEEFYNKYGFIRALTKKGDPQKHFLWLVQYQLLGWSMIQITEKHIESNPNEEDLNEEAVMKQIRNTAKLIGIKLEKRPVL